MRTPRKRFDSTILTGRLTGERIFGAYRYGEASADHEWQVFRVGVSWPSACRSFTAGASILWVDLRPHFSRRRPASLEKNLCTIPGGAKSVRAAYIHDIAITVDLRRRGAKTVQDRKMATPGVADVMKNCSAVM